MKAHKFSQKVQQRSRRIVSDSFHRADAASMTDSKSRSRGHRLLKGVLNRLPESLLDSLRDLLGADAQLDHVRALLREAHQHRRELEERDYLLGQQLKDVESEKNALRELKYRLRAQLKETTPKTAVPTIGQVVRVPLSKVLFKIEDAPRPPVEIARLSQNIKRFGQQTPVVCYELDGDYHLITGYRRMLALKKADCPFVDIRITAQLDAETAAALYIAENCMVRGVSLSEVKRLQASVKERVGFEGPIKLVSEDDENLEEEMTLTEVSEQMHYHLAEAAAWMAALRPHWSALGGKEKTSLVALIRYLAQVAKVHL